MKSLLVLLSLVALASCNPTKGLVEAALGVGAGVGGGVGGGGGPGGILSGFKAGAEAIAKVVVSGGGGAKGLPGGGIIGGGAPGGKGCGGGGGGHAVDKHGGGRTDRGYKQKGGVYPVGGGGVFQALAFLAQAITDVAGNARSIFEDVAHLRIPGILDDGFNSVISVGRGAGGIINAFIPGLGSLYGNLVVAIGKIYICLYGSPGISGTVLGDRRPGRDNPRDIPYICGPKYGSSWGCGYDGPYDNEGSIINHYRAKNSHKQALDYINQCTNGAGLNSLSGSRYIISLRIINIAKVLDKGSKNWTEQDIVIVLVNIVIINAVIGDSYQQGLGLKLVDEWFINLRQNKNKRFPDLSKHRDYIINVLKGTKEDRFGGAFDQTKRSGWERIRNSENTQWNNEDLRIHDAIQKTSKNTDKSSNAKSNSGSGKIVNRGAGTSQEYNYGSAEANNRERTAENTDTRVHDLSLKRDSDNNYNGDYGSEDLRVHDGSQQTSKNTDKSSNAKSNSGSGKTENRRAGTSQEYNYGSAEANNRERTAENTDTRVHDLSLKRDSDNNYNGDYGSEDLRVHDGSQQTSKNTDKSSNAKSNSGSGKTENRRAGTSQEYNYGSAEANNRERTAENTDTRVHDLSLKRDSDNNYNGDYGSEDLRVHDGGQQTSKNTDKSSNAKSNSGSGKTENRRAGTSQEYNYGSAEANNRERTAENTDTRVHDLSLKRDSDNNYNGDYGSEDLRVHDGSQQTSKNTDKSSNAKSNSGSGKTENRRAGTSQEYNYGSAEANNREKTAENTDTRVHDLSLNRDGNNNYNGDNGSEDLRVHDASQQTSKNTDKSSNAKSNSGSGKTENRGAGTSQEYNYGSAEANNREKTAENTDTRVHDLSLNRDGNNNYNGDNGSEDLRVHDASQQTSKNTDKSSNAKSNSGSGKTENRGAGTSQEYNYGSAEANNREKTAENTDTRVHDLSLNRDGNNNDNGDNGSEDLRVHDASQQTSKNTDKSSNAKSNSGSGKTENRGAGTSQEYNYGSAEANNREKTAENTDTRVHDLSLNRDGNNNYNGDNGSEDLRIHDASQQTSKNTDKSSNAKSNSGSGNIENRRAGTSQEYNYGSAEANNRERTAENTDTRVHDVSLQRDSEDC